MINVLNNFAILLISIIVIVITYYFIIFLRKITENNVQKIKNDKIRFYIMLAENAIESVVVATNQTYVNELKKQGKFNKEAHKIAFNKTKKDVLNILNDLTKQIINQVYGDLDTWIDNKIEYYISINK